MSTAKKTTSLLPLQEKAVKSGLQDLNDQETLELMLNLCTPGKDYHKIARRIVTRFKNLKELVESPAEQLQQIPGVSQHDMMFLTVMRSIFRKCTVERILERPIYTPGRIVFEYLRPEMQNLQSEHFKMLFLDSKKIITATSDFFNIKPDVSLSQSLRTVIEQAIRHQSRYFILVHNHLSGDPKPTKNDLEITRDMVFAGMIIQIKALDHVIISRDSFFSFSNEGLLDEYEAEYLDLKLRGTTNAKRRLDKARKATGKD
jgi:DNA repair protein RadC